MKTSSEKQTSKGDQKMPPKKATDSKSTRSTDSKKSSIKK
jgi:hypothetical protein